MDNEYSGIPPRPKRALGLGEVLIACAIVIFLGMSGFLVLRFIQNAKLAAKTKASISNIKQISLSALMYSTDNNDKFVLAGGWHSNDPDACKHYPNSWYMPWPGLLENYLKNHGILESPLARAPLPFVDTRLNQCHTTRQCTLLYPTYGYNAVYLSPSNADKFYKGLTTHIQMGSYSTSAVRRPAHQVMFTEIWSRGKTGFRAFSGGADNAYVSFATAEPPDGATDLGIGKPFGRLSWGSYLHLIPSAEEGRFQAGVAFRCQGRQTPVAFADGHVKALSPEALAVGTDWVSGMTGQARNLHNGKYMWDPR